MGTLVKMLTVWIVALVWSVAMSFVIALPISMLWNAVVASTFSFPELTYLNTVGLLVLLGLVTGSAKLDLKFQS